MERHVLELLRGPRRSAAICAVLAVATLAAYGSFAGFEFVNWDDNEYVSDNPHVQAGLTFDSIRWALTATESFNWHPLTWLSHMLDVELFGLAPAWHHRMSVWLHVATTLLLFLAFSRMSGAVWRSAFVAGLFALHPQHVESVAWIAERKDVLSALCFAASLSLYARYAERPSTSRYVAVGVVFAAGLAAKPMLVTLPVVLLLVDVWPLRRLRLAPEPDLRRLGALVLEKLPLFALSAASCVITLIAQRGAISLASHLTLGDRLGNALVSYLRYLGGALLPVQLSVSYAHPGAWPTAVILGCGLLLALITAATLRVLSTRPWLCVGWLWFLVMLVPVIGAIQVGEQAMADRYMYLPSLGLFVMVAWEVPSRLQASVWRTRVLALAAGALLVTLGLLTRAQVQHWRSSTSLWEHARAVDPRSSLAPEMLAAVARTQARDADALELYRRAVELDPGRANAWYGLGDLLSRMDRPAEAIEPLREALRIRPGFALAWESLGYAYRDLGQLEPSLQAFQRSVEIDPAVASVQYNLGVANLRAGRTQAALGPFNAALRLRPDLALALVGLGDAHATLGDRAASLAAFERALRLAREQGDRKLALSIETHLVQLREAPSR